MSDAPTRISAEQTERICADARRIAAASAASQGVPASVIDPGVLLRIAGVLDQADGSNAAASVRVVGR